MKIATWNVNSIRARCEVVVGWLQTWQPDVLCVQETKVEDASFPVEAFEKIGYGAAFSGQKAYNGVAIFSRWPIADVCAGLPDAAQDPQRRVLTATIQGIRLINVYVPNGESVISPKFSYKLEFFKKLQDYLARCCKETDALLIMGDFNVAPEARDVYDPDGWEGEVLCHPHEREAMKRLQSVGVEDLFRRFHPEGGHYSWWDYRMASFRQNLGLRIDHIMATASLSSRCVSCEIDREIRGIEKPSDHAPVVAAFQL